MESMTLVHQMHLHWRADANDDQEMIEPAVWQCTFAPPLPNEIASGNLLIM